MAKRKKRSSNVKTRTRTITKRVRSKSSGGSFAPQKAIGGGFIYGLARGKVANLISPLTSKIPMGQYADELGLGILNYYIAKGKIKMIPKNIGLAGLAIESFVVGQDIGSGNFSLSNNNNNNKMRQF